MLVSSGSSRPRTLEELLPPGLAARLDRLDLVSRRVFAGKLPGERRSKRRGRSVEFDDFRNYTAGDDLRHIDWNVYARLDRLFIKLFREEEDLALELIVDSSASMDAGAEDSLSPPTTASTASAPSAAVPTKLAFVHRLAMSLAYIGLINQNRVAVTTFGHTPGTLPEAGPPAAADGTRRLLPVRGRTSLQRVAHFLLQSLTLPPAAGFPPADALRDLSRRIGGRGTSRGVIVVLSDLLWPAPTTPGTDGALREIDRALGGLSAVAQRGFDVYLCQTLSPTELDPARATDQGLVGDLLLTDIETGHGAEVTVAPALIARYRQRLVAFTNAIKQRALVHGVAPLLIDTSAPVDRLVTDALRRGGMLR